MTGATTFFAVLYVFAHIAMKWATDRMKDWEAAPVPKLGAPGLACWAAGVATLTATMFGAHIFAWLYFVLLKQPVKIHNIVMIGCMVFEILWLWCIFLMWMR